jgi:drug/metabolite transporter (DMT)-like permease
MIAETFPEAYALVATVAWIVSTLVINRGLERKPAGNGVYRIALGLNASLVTGSVLLSFVVLPRVRVGDVSVFLILAGVCSFPLGTGLYYYASEAYEERSELAAQFNKTKPLFAVGFAVFVVGESLSPLTVVALACITVGLGVLLVGTLKGRFSNVAMVLGTATAVAWALGDGFITLGVDGVDPLVATYVALVTGTVLYSLISLPLILRKLPVPDAMTEPWLAFFVAHGVLSFAVGYVAFFTSIATIGLTRSALITAFWPFSAIVLGHLIQSRHGDEGQIAVDRRYFFPAALILVIGSVLAVFA